MSAAGKRRFFCHILGSGGVRYGEGEVVPFETLKLRLVNRKN